MRKPLPDSADQAVGRPATGPSLDSPKKNVFEDIALAHREIYALYEIAQAMGTSLGVSDTMALIAGSVTASCAAVSPFSRSCRGTR